MADWEINGIKGFGDLPAIAGTFSGPVVIIGGASCVWDDLAQVIGKPDYMAINLSGYFAHKTIRHWATCHPQMLPYYLGLYHEFYFPTDTENDQFNFFAHIMEPHIQTHAPMNAENNWQFVINRGSSGIFATQVALALGYEQVWLAGIPLDSSRSLFDPPWAAVIDYGEQYQEEWLKAADLFKGRVKSFSGFTRELLGAPEQ